MGDMIINKGEKISSMEKGREFNEAIEKRKAEVIAKLIKDVWKATKIYMGRVLP